MNTHNLELTAKARHLCFLLPLLMSLVWGLPGPCRHSVTKDHLLSLSRLMDNQLENGCSIVYAFTERQNLSEVCYVKAAFPHILELLNSHFNYAKNSDNRRYVSTLRRVIFNLYSQGCVPEINEEIEDSPVRFTRVLCSSPKEALQKARRVVEMYAVLLRQRNSPVDWSCQEEYAALEYEEEEEEEEEPPATITPTATIPTLEAVASGVFECQCPCPWFPKAPTPSSSIAQSWSPRTQPAQNQTTAALPSGFTRHPYHTDTTLSPGTIDKDNLTASPFKTAAFSHSQPFGERESSDVPARVIKVPYSPEAVSVRVPVLMAETDGQADKDLMYRSEASTTGPSVLSENESVSPILGLADGQRTFSSGETTTHGLAKGTLEAKDFDSQHRYDTVLLSQEDVLRLEYYESKATNGTHRATPKSTADNHDDFTMDQMAFMDARALRRRQKYSSKYRIFPRDLRRKAKDIPSTATAKSESEETRTAHQDRSRSRDTFR